MKYTKHILYEKIYYYGIKFGFYGQNFILEKFKKIDRNTKFCKTTKNFREDKNFLSVQKLK